MRKISPVIVVLIGLAFVSRSSACGLRWCHRCYEHHHSASQSYGAKNGDLGAPSDQMGISGASGLVALLHLLSMVQNLPQPQDNTQLEQRISALETDVASIKQDIADIRTELQTHLDLHNTETPDEIPDPDLGAPPAPDGGKPAAQKDPLKPLQAPVQKPQKTPAQK